jgi:YfiH family protein
MDQPPVTVPTPTSQADGHREITATASFSPASQALPPGWGIPFAFPGVPNVRCLFSTCLAGNMALTPQLDDAERRAAVQARRDLTRGLGLSGWVELHQVHGSAMHVDPDPTDLDRASTLEGDGACTGREGLALVVKTADCQPILLTDIRGTAVAALHVGWRGNTVNFPARGVAAFCEAYGVRTEDVLAVRGPSLGPGAAEFVNFEAEWPPEFAPWFDHTLRVMDLWALTRSQLEGAGLSPRRIFSLDLCTRSLPEMFFSYRRGHAGRQVSLVWKI